RGIYRVRPRLLFSVLEFLLVLGCVDAADLDRTRQAQAPGDQRLPPELLHHGNTRVVPDAKVDAVVAVRAELGERVVDARHRVDVVRERPAGTRTPGGVRVARDGSVVRDAEGIAAEAEVLRVAVERRRREVVERVDAAADQAQVSVGQDRLER